MSLIFNGCKHIINLILSSNITVKSLLVLLKAHSIHSTPTVHQRQHLSNYSCGLSSPAWLLWPKEASAERNWRCVYVWLDQLSPVWCVRMWKKKLTVFATAECQAHISLNMSGMKTSLIKQHRGSRSDVHLMSTSESQFDKMEYYLVCESLRWI